MKNPDAKAKIFQLPELTYRVWKVWRRNVDVFMKTWKVNFFPPLLEPIFYLAALGTGLGYYLGTQIEGYSYTQFIAPGIVAITIMYSSFFECTYGSFVRMYYQRTFDAIIGGGIVLAVVAAFGLISSPLFALILVVAFFSGLMFSAMAMCFTALAPSIDFFNYPQYLFITPMFVLGGTFFPVAKLPEALQVFAQAVLPLTHTVNLARWLMFGSSELSIVISIVWIAAVTPFFFVLAVNLMKRKLVK